MSFDCAELTNAIARHGRVARVVIADVKGSTPREVGASMLVWDGGQSGTIGGGALEFEAARKALNGPDLDIIPLGPNLGQCCGGSVTLVSEIYTAPIPKAPYFSRRIKGLRDEPLSVSKQKQIARQGGRIKPIFENGWFFEPMNSPKSPLWIYGAGHVGRALVHTLSTLPHYDITWIDTSPDRFPKVIPDGVTQLVAASPSLSVRHAPTDAQHLILTYSHALDLELCHQLLTQGFQFAGLIGSATKWARFRSRLRALGHTESQISRITCPIGTPEFGKHPQEIAVGVASSLLSRRTQESYKEDLAI